MSSGINTRHYVKNISRFLVVLYQIILQFYCVFQLVSVVLIPVSHYLSCVLLNSFVALLLVKSKTSIYVKLLFLLLLFYS